jgi:hypothetical protein
MPSVDRVGRYYPLTIAAVASNIDAPALIRLGRRLLNAAECAGRKAVEQELAPDQLAAHLTAAHFATAGAPSAAPAPDPLLCPPCGGLWWTPGAPRVSSSVFASTGLPDENTFSTMLVSCSILSSALFPEVAR